MKDALENQCARFVCVGDLQLSLLHFFSAKSCLLMYDVYLNEASWVQGVQDHLISLLACIMALTSI